MTSEDLLSIIPFIALFISFLSLCVAFGVSRTARRALKITQATYHDRQSNFDIYLIDGFKWKDKDESIILLNITINNKSDTKDTFKANLEIQYLKSDEQLTTALLTHNPQLLTHISKNNMTSFETNIRLEEKHFESKWLFFQQPKNPFDNYRILKYMIQITDSKGNKKTLDTYILRNLL